MTDECEVEVDGVKLTLRRHKPDDQLRRFEAAEALRALGYPISYDTLSAMVTRRNGPPYYKFGKLTFYRYGELVAWAQARMRRAG
jgi:hypothetical protein